MSDDRPLARPWEPAAVALSELLPRTARGSKRDGVYALWLTVRVALDFGLTRPSPTGPVAGGPPPSSAGSPA